MISITFLSADCYRTRITLILNGLYATTTLIKSSSLPRTTLRKYIQELSSLKNKLWEFLLQAVKKYDSGFTPDLVSWKVANFWIWDSYHFGF